LPLASTSWSVTIKLALVVKVGGSPTKNYLELMPISLEITNFKNNP
jgi:hypothetical protein